MSYTNLGRLTFLLCGARDGDKIERSNSPWKLRGLRMNKCIHATLPPASLSDKKLADEGWFTIPVGWRTRPSNSIILAISSHLFSRFYRQFDLSRGKRILKKWFQLVKEVWIKSLQFFLINKTYFWIFVCSKMLQV